MRPCRFLSLLGGIALLLVPATGVSQQARLGVGLFAPEIPFASPAERYSLVQGIASHLSNALGTPVEGRAYKSVLDFERDVRARKTHFGIVGAAYAAAKPGIRVLAAARLTGQADHRWSIMCKRKVSLLELKDKVLQVPNLGAIVLRLVENGLLAGSVDVKKHFRVKTAPDLASAVTAVRVGHADAVFAPVETSGLVAVVGGLPMPPPALVLLDDRVPAQQVSKAVAAMLSYGATIANIQGWRAAHGGYQELSAASRKRTLKMVMAAEGIVRLHGSDLVDVSGLAVQMPALEELFWLP